MMPLVGLFTFYILSIFVGRTTRRTNAITYAILALVALIQVGIVLAALYNLEPPKLLQKLN